MSDLNAFRNETRDWLEANCPESMRTPMSQGDVVWGGRKVEFKDPDQKVHLEAQGLKAIGKSLGTSKWFFLGLSKWLDSNLSVISRGWATFLLK